MAILETGERDYGTRAEWQSDQRSESERARIAQAAPIAGRSETRRGSANLAPGDGGAGLAQRRQCDPIGGATGCHAWFGQPLVAVVRSGGNGGSAGTRTAGRRGAPVGSAAPSRGRHGRSRPDGRRLSERDLDRADDRRVDPATIWRDLPQSSHSALAAQAGVLGATTTQAAGEGRRRAPSDLAEGNFPGDKKKPRLAVASFCSKTKPASGSMARCIEPGRA